MKQIYLTQGLVALVSDQDYVWLSEWEWCAHYNPDSGKFYAVRSVRFGEKKVLVYMSRQILGLSDRRVFAEHKNGNTLDNQRENLRPSTNAQNQANVGLVVRNTSGFKGITWMPKRKKWQARIRHQGKKLFLGYFDLPEEAHEAYKVKALELYGEFARFK
jgi:hypothetical protein